MILQFILVPRPRAPLIKVHTTKSDKLFHSTDCITYNSLFHPSGKDLHEPLDMDIMATCRQLHAEAADVFYTRNIFVHFARSSSSAQRELESKGSLSEVARQYCPLIRHAVFQCPKDNLTFGLEVARMLKSWPGLNRVELFVPPVILQHYQEILQKSEHREDTIRQVARNLNTVLALHRAPIPQNLELISVVEDRHEFKRSGSVSLLPRFSYLTDAEIAELRDTGRAVLNKAKEKAVRDGEVAVRRLGRTQHPFWTFAPINKRAAKARKRQGRS